MIDQQQTDERAWQRVRLDRIQDRTDDLTRPSTTREHQRVWNGDRQRFDMVPHVLEHPSLINQLRLTGAGSTAGLMSSSLGSKPPASIDAVSHLDTMERETRLWWRKVEPAKEPGKTLEIRLHLLAARASTLTDDQLSTLDGDVMRWWATARVASGWDSAPLKPHVPCMVCEKVGQIRLRIDPLSAVCLACGAAWDETTIGILGNHVRIMLEEPIELPPLVVGTVATRGSAADPAIKP